MGLTNIQNYIVGILLGFAVFLSGILWASAGVGYYHLSGTDLNDFNNSMGQLQGIYNVTNTLDTSLSTSGASVGPLGWLNFLIGSAWTGLQTIGLALSFVPNAIMGFGAYLGIPPNLTWLLVCVPLVIIIFGIWMAILRVTN